MKTAINIETFQQTKDYAESTSPLEYWISLIEKKGIDARKNIIDSLANVNTRGMDRIFFLASTFRTAYTEGKCSEDTYRTACKIIPPPMSADY